MVWLGIRKDGNNMSPLDRLTQFAEPMINLRRYFHQYPELSLEEFQTTQYIADFFEELV